jgi:hypothetical protein
MCMYCMHVCHLMCTMRESSHTNKNKQIQIPPLCMHACICVLRVDAGAEPVENQRERTRERESERERERTSERARESERERARERERERDRETERQRDRETKRLKDRKRERLRVNERQRKTDVVYTYPHA